VLPVELPIVCESCDAASGAFELDQARTVYRNFQIVSLQESPGTVPAGRVPRYKSVYVSGDLIDLARPGEEVEITGIYENMLDLNLNSQNGFPVFSTRIVANYIQKKEDVLGNISISEEDKAMFRNMAKDRALVNA
jgi:DNA replication licensing factor MCM2